MCHIPVAEKKHQRMKQNNKRDQSDRKGHGRESRAEKENWNEGVRKGY